MHPILGRQLRQLGNLTELQGTPEFERFLGLIDQTYEELESDRRFAEHTLRTVSGELFEANETIRKESDRQIAGQEAQLTMAMQSAGDGLWSYEAGAARLELSPSWIQMLGYGNGDLPADASVCERLIHPEDWEAARAALREAVEGGEIVSREVRVRPRSGEPLWMLVRGRVVERDADGSPRRLVGTLINISAQKQIEKDLRAAKEAAEAANAAKSRFLAVMSHEIRTPMNGVLGFASLLGETPLDALQGEYLEMIQSSGKMLIAIINDILDFSRIESGLFELTRERFSPYESVAEICALLRPQAQAKSIALEHPARDAGTGFLVGDSLRFRQILLNLIGNAIKFTETGRVQVGLREEPGAEGEPWLVLEVRDTGSGISPENLPTIFEPFAQGDMSITRKYGGTGLGLAITKRLVEVMGGAIEVESAPGGGTLFRVTLPQRKDFGEPLPLAKKNSETRTVAVAALPKISALVVEDNRISRVLAVRLLNSLGCEVAVAEDGSQAVEMVKEAGYDVIFMDMDMPVMDGLSATRLIRQIPGREHLPIYALSANALDSDCALCLQAGMNGFITKPYEKAVVSSVLMQVSTRCGAQ